MHPYAPWPAAIRQVLLCRIPAAEAPSAVASRYSRLCLRSCSSKRHIHPIYGGRSTSTRRLFSMTMENKEEMLLKARAVLTKLLSPPYESRTAPHRESLLSAAEQIESEPSSTSVRIAVYGPDLGNSAQKFIAAVLDDPLSSDPALHTHIRDRLKSQLPPKLRNFHHAHSHSHIEDSTSIPSPFLSRFAHPVNLQELTSAPPESQPSLSAFLSSDIPILLISPLLTPSESLSTLSSVLPPNLHGLILINSGLDASSETARLIRTAQADKLHYSANRIFFVDVDRALRGLVALRSDPHSPVAIKQYQDDYLGSNLPQVVSTLEETTKLGPSTLRADARSALTSRVISSCSSILSSQQSQIDDVRLRVSTLRSSILEEKEKILKEVLGAAAEDTEVGRLEMGEEEGSIIEGVERVAKDVRPAMDSLAWWKLPLIVDDVSARIDRAVEGAYVKEFQNQLVYQAGRLSALQTHMVMRTGGLLDSLPPSFTSSVLRNTLSQISSNPSFPLTPTTLLSPLYSRLRQFTHATRALHLSAQRALLVTFSSSALSATFAYTLWIIGSMNVQTATSTGILAALLGLRYAVGRWERAKKNWWGDWQRVGEGLERDVKKAVSEVLDKQVCVVPEEACRGLDELVEKRKVEVGDAESEVERLKEEVEKQK